MPTDTAAPVDDASIDAAIAADLATLDTPTDEPAGDQAPSGESTTDSPTGDTPTTYTLSDGTEVPLDELEKGYLRQSDYTRKTQDVARQREEMQQAIRLAEALQADPEGTLDALRNALLGDEDTEDLDPVAAKLQEHEQFIQAQQDAEFERQLNADLDRIASEFGEIDREAVIQYAIDNEIPNLRASYLDMTYSQTQQQKVAERNAAAVAAKRNAPPVAPGGSRALGSDAVQQAEVKTLNDALGNALAELGITDW